MIIPHKKIRGDISLVFWNAHCFFVILPELASWKSDVDNTENEKLYCICQRPSFLPMITCDGANCKIE